MRLLALLAAVAATFGLAVPAGGQTAVTPAPAAEAPAAATELRVDREAVAFAARDRGPEVTVEGVEPFTMFGLSNDAFAGLQVDPAEPNGSSEPAAEVRFHDEAGWGAWVEIHASPEQAPDTGTAEGAATALTSEPVWVGAADGYQVRLPPESTATAAEAVLVRDTGEPLAPVAEPRYPTTDPDVAARQAVADQPPIRGRSSWAARPPSTRLYRSDNLSLAVVHHAVTANVYSPAEVPGIIRSIQTFHMDGNGWYDIAYNFVIDRFGTIWEGRAGGIGNTVIGGHAKGFNTGSTGVVALGSFDTAGVTSAMRNAFSTLIGWKLFIHGVDPSTSTTWVSRGNETYPEGTPVPLPRIVGHRDTAATGCPGTYLYAQLPTIRSGAAAHYRTLRGPGTFRSVPVSLGLGRTPLVGDFDGDGNDDVVFYGVGSIDDGLAWGRDDGRYAPQSLAITGDYRPLVGDFDGDYLDDIFWYGPDDGYDKLWFGQANRSFARVDVLVEGTYEPIVGDFDDDDADDILWYGRGSEPDSMWWGRADRSFTGGGIAVSRSYTPLVGDFDGDGPQDIFWYGPGAASDSLWLGSFERAFESRAPVVHRTYRPVVGDFDGDQHDDILWYAPGTAGDALWAGRADGTFRTRGPVNIDGTYTPLVGDFNGGGYDDLLLYGPGASPDRTLYSAGNGTFRSTVVSVTGTYNARVVRLGRDARADVLWFAPGIGTDRVWLSVP
jgi:hypothetical protein